MSTKTILEILVGLLFGAVLVWSLLRIAADSDAKMHVFEVLEGDRDEEL